MGAQVKNPTPAGPLLRTLNLCGHPNPLTRPHFGWANNPAPIRAGAATLPPVASSDERRGVLVRQRAPAARLPLLPRAEARSSTGGAAPLPPVASSDELRVTRSTEGRDGGLAGSSPSRRPAMAPGPFSSTWACASSSAPPLPWRLRPPLPGVGPFSSAAVCARARCSPLLRRAGLPLLRRAGSVPSAWPRKLSPRSPAGTGECSFCTRHGMWGGFQGKKIDLTQ